MPRRRFCKKKDQRVVAVQLSLDTSGLVYRKWGGIQQAKRGDWLVDNRGEIYTVDRRMFAKTYKRRSPGIYYKVATVWAERAQRNGSIVTHEGRTRYKKGDYIVYESGSGRAGYSMTAARFTAMYRRPIRKPSQTVSSPNPATSRARR